MSTQDDNISKIIKYHEFSKHGFYRYAPSLGYLDWATQPDPFRRYKGAKSIPLLHFSEIDGPSFDDILVDRQGDICEFNRESISKLLYDSLSLSAWKSYQGSKWSLRVNPSSGNLHPTEAYLISGAISGLYEQPVVCHYLSENHSLEVRTEYSVDLWQKLKGKFPDDTIFIGLSSIYWREAWKYGERAFRYCHHDIGHAIGSISIASSEMGWKARLIKNISHDEMQTLLGLCCSQNPKEIEDAGCLIAIYKKDKSVSLCEISKIKEIKNLFSELNWEGEPNILSNDHVEWPALHEVASETKKKKLDAEFKRYFPKGDSIKNCVERDGVHLRKLIRQRRSAVAMDGVTTISYQTFFQILLRTLPGSLNFPFLTLPWEPLVHLGLFVHRVEGIPPGLYLLVRNKDHLDQLYKLSKNKFLWKKLNCCPESIDLYLLVEENVQRAAMSVSCGQDIASDGCFSLGMITAFMEPLQKWGPSFYPKLYWECGLVGQILYLLAEKYKIQSTGIGCFFDNPVHEIFGISDHSFQSLYHFTIGGAVDDHRLITLPPYSESIANLCAIAVQ